MSALRETARLLVGNGKGILAMDESSPTCDARLTAAGIPATSEARRAYRELIVTTPNLNDSVAGVILYDETIRQGTADGTPFLDILKSVGILPGIKVDTGTTALAGRTGEKITEGLDGLRHRLEEYVEMGARFAKWRAVISLEDGHPSQGCIDANAQALARYAALCQEAGLVPMVEPEVLMTGAHSLEQCDEVTEQTLRSVFEQLHVHGVALDGMILKPNMVLPGLDAVEPETEDDVATATLDCLRRVVPAAVAGVAFLSGGQSGERAAARLNAINLRANAAAAGKPWPLAFSFARALQQPALMTWQGEARNVVHAQVVLAHRARCAHAAMAGKYTASMEH